MSMHEEVLDILKQKLLPEIQDMQAWRVEMKAELTVINGRLDHFDKRFEQVDKRFEDVLDQMRSRFEQQDRRLDDVHGELRELRSYAFRQQFEQTSYSARKHSAAV